MTVTDRECVVLTGGLSCVSWWMRSVVLSTSPTTSTPGTQRPGRPWYVVTNTPLTSFFLKSTLRLISIVDLWFCICSVVMLLMHSGFLYTIMHAFPSVTHLQSIMDINISVNNFSFLKFPLVQHELYPKDELV